jgi:hypothetical protein
MALPTRLTSAVLRALEEDPDLLAEPVVPLGELLPFEEELGPGTDVWENHQAGRRLTVHLPERVYGELSRRSELLGDRLTDDAGMLLGAAADRVAPRIIDYPYPREPSWSEYDGQDADVVPFR